jgi:broad specificity phosphatase PhoE
MPGLTLVRHAMSAVERGVASKRWGITEAAREDCLLLSEHLPPSIAPCIYASGERKSLETAQVIAPRKGCDVVVDDGFAEVDRPATWDNDYRALAAAYVGGAAHPAWEPAATVHDRFGRAARRARGAHADADVVVVNHGMALTLYLAAFDPVVVARGEARAFDAVAFWRALTFPDAWRLDTASNTVTRVFDAGLPPPDA